MQRSINSNAAIRSNIRRHVTSVGQYRQATLELERLLEYKETVQIQCSRLDAMVALKRIELKAIADQKKFPDGQAAKNAHLRLLYADISDLQLQQQQIGLNANDLEREIQVCQEELKRIKATAFDVETLSPEAFAAFMDQEFEAKQVRSLVAHSIAAATRLPHGVILELLEEPPEVRSRLLEAYKNELGNALEVAGFLQSVQND